MMLALLAFVPLAYESTLICKVPASTFQSYVNCTVLTDQETVAGFTCAFTGHHGETFAGKPFVWTQGKFVKLPLLPKAEYGHVYGGNDRVLLGSVAIDYRNRPVKWGPDPKVGWLKPVVTQISSIEGSATHIGPDGAIWIQNGNQLIGNVKDGRWLPVNFGKFALAGFDARGKMYGYKFNGLSFGNRPTGTTPGWYFSETWHELPVIKPSENDFMENALEAVNPAGVAVGNCQDQLAIWQDGKVTLPLRDKFRWSFASDIGSSGAVLGTGAIADINGEMVFLWKDGKLTDLTRVVPGIKLGYANKVNRHGAIAAWGLKKSGEKLDTKSEAMLYLLRPDRSLR